MCDHFKAIGSILPNLSPYPSDYFKVLDFRSMYKALNIVLFSSLWPSEAILHDRLCSTLVLVMACHLLGPSQYLNHCGCIVNQIVRNISEI